MHDIMTADAEALDYEKAQKEKKERIAKLKKAHPNNKILSEMVEEEKDRTERKKRQKDNKFSLISTAMWRAEELYMEGDLTFEEATSDLIEVIKACCNDTH